MTLPPFTPLPFLRNGHVQTILGAFAGMPRPLLRPRLQFVPLKDGDALALHIATPAAWRPDQPTVLLVHGLGGCHQSGYMVRVANGFLARGWRAVRVDLRGAGAGAGSARRLYNAGCSGDIRQALEYLHTQAPQSPLVLIGFSLGGNIVLKLAGEAADHPVLGLAAVATLAAPIDLLRCHQLLSQYAWYDRFFVRHLVGQVRCQEALLPSLTRMVFPRRLSLRGFDDLYTAPRGNFRDALDYYERASSLPLIERIKTPTLLLTARDDPFICVEPFEALKPTANLDVRIIPHGGHLGFLGWDGRGGIRWAEHFLEEWVWQRVGRATTLSR